MIVPITVGDVSSIIAERRTPYDGVGTIPRWGTSRSAVSPPGTFCPPLPPFVVDYVSR